MRKKKRQLRKDGLLKGRGSARDIQLMQAAGVDGAENFGVTNIEAAKGKLNKTTDSFKSRVEGQTMDKSAGQLGNVQDKVVMEKGKTVTNVTETSRPIEGTGTPGQENVSGVRVTTNNEDNANGPQKNKYGKNKSPFKMGGPGSAIVTGKH